MGVLSSSRFEPGLSRRVFLGAGTVCLGLTAAPALARIAADSGARRLALHNLHTDESLKSVYWADGRYVPGALDEIDHVLRDHRTNTVHAIDPRLLDVLHHLQNALGTNAPYQVISGYRSPESNAKLAALSEGVAHHSLHMQGMAIDVRVAGVDLSVLHKAAQSLGAGGVGYYPRSDFVHVDVGRVRYW